MFSFRVQGFAGSCDSYWRDSPIDVTVFAETEAEAIKKVEAVTGKELSALHRKITTIEAEPVKHGRWIVLGQRTYGSGSGRNYTHYCSECGQHGFDDYKLCPNCGAKMEEGEE